MNSIDNIWSDIKERMVVKISSPSYEAWINKLELFGVSDNSIVLVARNRQSKNVVESKFLPQLKQSAFESRCPYGNFIIITPDEKDKYSSSEPSNIDILESADESNEYANFNKNYTFDSFVVGSCNELVAAASKAVAENPGFSYNPLFIYGGVGLGKTHLLHAIGNYIHDSKPSFKVMYITAESFTNELIYAIRNGSNPELMRAFREKYRACDVLMIDDIQFLSGKVSTQEALFHIFNDLYNSNKQIILTSDKPLSAIQSLEERLVSRFAWGLIADIQPPNFETRVAILQKKAFQHHFNLDIEVIRYIAEKNSTNIRMIEGMLQNVVFYIRLNDTRADHLQLAKEALKDFDHADEEQITVDRIIDTVASYFNLSRDLMLSKKKNKEIVEPRQIAMYLITDMMPLIPLTVIGQKFSGRDHTTVIHARDKVAQLLSSNDSVSQAVVNIRNKILNK